MRIWIFAVLIIFSLGCSPEPEETTTKGKLHVFIPESIAPVMMNEVNEFLNLYRQHGAKISTTIVSSVAATQHFVKDTSRILFLPRPLTQEEKNQVKHIADNLNELIVAYDGIVVFVHPKNTMEQMSTTSIQNILAGKIKRWEQLPFTKSMKGSINVYCQDSSDVSEYLVQRFVQRTGILAKFIHTSSDLQTLQSVENDRLALGFAALSWIDSAKSTAKVLNLGRTAEDTDTTFAPPEEAKNNFFSPHPANIYRNYYPLKRAIYMYTLGRVDLAAGFGTYVATVEGQKIFLNRGLLPGTQNIKLKSQQP